MSVTTRIRANHRPFHRGLSKLERQPDPEMVAKLDAVLTAGFTAVQAATHVQTGALKASLKKRSQVQRSTDTWRGEITAGGGPVDYAIYERRREPDEHGDHDFLRPLDATELATLRAILGGLK